MRFIGFMCCLSHQLGLAEGPLFVCRVLFESSAFIASRLLG